MPIRATFALLCLTGATIAGGSPGQEVSIVPLLKSGDEFRLEITRVRENSARPAQNSKGTAPVDVRVVSAGADGFVLEWAPARASVPATHPAARDPLVLATANALSGMRVGLRLNADGEYTGLVNEEAVVAQVQKAVDVLVRGLVDKVPEAQRPGLQKMFAQVLSPAVLVASVTRDAQTFVGLNGLSLSPGRTLEMEIQQPNPFGGGGAIPAMFRVSLTSVTADSAAFQTTTSFDPAALKQLTRAAMEQTGKPMPQRDVDQLTLQMSDEGRFVLDRGLGLMREVVVNRRITSGKEQRLDRLEIRMVRAPQR